MSSAAPPVLTSAGLLTHWQGHRRLTRRVIAAFPDDQINSFSVGGMRPFGELVQELLSMAIPTMVGITTGTWKVSFDRKTQSKAELLADWDAQSRELDTLWPKVRPAAWQEVMDAFGYFQGPAVDILLYIIDNEVHHRAQGYVYLRAQGIEPPQFPDRS
jgi:uncharacterized damage-inducible protein DinB